MCTGCPLPAVPYITCSNWSTQPVVCFLLQHANDLCAQGMCAHSISWLGWTMLSASLVGQVNIGPKYHTIHMHQPCWVLAMGKPGGDKLIRAERGSKDEEGKDNREDMVGWTILWGMSIKLVSVCAQCGMHEWHIIVTGVGVTMDDMTRDNNEHYRGDMLTTSILSGQTRHQLY